MHDPLAATTGDWTTEHKMQLTQYRLGRLRLHGRAYWRTKRHLRWHLRCIWQDFLHRN